MAVTIHPPNESASQIFTEKAWLQGAILLTVSWGINFNLFVMAVYLTYQKIKRKIASRQQIFILAYTCVLFGFGTVVFVSVIGFIQFAFITDRNYPGGPAQVQKDLFSVAVDEPSNITFVVGNWFANYLIIWRYAVIYQGCRVPRWLVLTPIILLLMGDMTTGILFARQLSTTSPYDAPVVNWTIPYFSVSLALNIIVTVAIVGRLLLHRYRLVRALGPGHGSQYTSVAAMIVESAAIYSFFSILFLVPFAINNPVSHVFLRAMGGVQLSATLLIVMRVAQGTAWNATTNASMFSSAPQRAGHHVSKVSTVRFAVNPNMDSSNSSTNHVSISQSSSARSVGDLEAGVDEKMGALSHPDHEIAPDSPDQSGSTFDAV